MINGGHIWFNYHMTHPIPDKLLCSGLVFVITALLIQNTVPIQIAKFMGPTWVLSASDGPMLAPRTLLLGYILWYMTRLGSTVVIKACLSQKKPQKRGIKGIARLASGLECLIGNEFYILPWHNMASESRNSPTTRMFSQQLINANSKQAIKTPHHWPFVRVIYRWHVGSPHKQPVIQKHFDAMSSLCKSLWIIYIAIMLHLYNCSTHIDDINWTILYTYSDNLYNYHWLMVITTASKHHSRITNYRCCQNSVNNCHSCCDSDSGDNIIDNNNNHDRRQISVIYINDVDMQKKKVYAISSQYYNDVIMSPMASQITSLTIVYSTI